MGKSAGKHQRLAPTPFFLCSAQAVFEQASEPLVPYQWQGQALADMSNLQGVKGDPCKLLPLSST